MTAVIAPLDTLDPPPLAPGHLPGIGHLVTLLRDPIGYMTRLTTGPELVTMKIGPRTLYVINTLELLHTVLTTRADEFTQGVVFQKANAVLGQGMIVSDGDLHRRQRKLMQPALRRLQVEKYTGYMVEAVETFADSLTLGTPIDVVEEMHGLGLDVLCNALFGGALSPETAHAVKVVTPDIMGGVVARVLYPAKWMEKLPLGVNRRFEAALPRLNRAVAEIIDAHRARPDEDDEVTGLRMIMEAKDAETGQPMPFRQLRDEVNNLIVAGTEAVGTMLGWFFHEVAMHPDIQARMVAEIDEVVGDGPLTAENLARLTYSKAVVAETLRRHTPTWLLSRKATATTELAGYRIPEGGEMVFSLTVLHRNPELYDDPMRFDPDRWVDGRTDSLPKWGFLPFVTGHRRCLGDHFSRHAMLITAVAMVRRWRMVHTGGGGEKIRDKALALVIPNNLTMHPEKQTR